MPRPLQLGMNFPLFELVASRVGAASGNALPVCKWIVVCFCSSNPNQAILDGLTQFWSRTGEFHEQRACFACVTDMRQNDTKSVLTTQLLGSVPLLSGVKSSTLEQCRVLGDRDEIVPTTYVIDEHGAIRSIYDSTRFPTYPNPSIVLRSLRKLQNSPNPAEMSPADWRLGPQDAVVALLEYSDYQCAHCQSLFTLIHRLIPDYGSKLVIVHRHLPLQHSHPLAFGAAEAAEAAGAQGHFWQMHQKLFEAKGRLEQEDLIALAGELDLDVAQFTSDLDTHRFAPAVREDFDVAVKNGITLPPTLFVNRVLFDGPRTEIALRERIESLLV